MCKLLVVFIPVDIGYYNASSADDNVSTHGQMYAIFF